MGKETIFETVHENVAGIDIGAEHIFVSPDGKEVSIFETFTSGYHACAAYLKQKGIKKAAMEATGIYWIALYFLLEESGIQVCLVNPKETKQVKGRKTDVKDCQWIQKLFSAGILRHSFIPEGKYMELRQLVRERVDIIDSGRVTGEHLHFAVRYHQHYIDPLRFLLMIENNINPNKKENKP
jgi:transposase